MWLTPRARALVYVLGPKLTKSGFLPVLNEKLLIFAEQQEQKYTNNYKRLVKTRANDRTQTFE